MTGAAAPAKRGTGSGRLLPIERSRDPLPLRAPSCASPPVDRDREMATATVHEASRSRALRHPARHHERFVTHQGRSHWPYTRRMRDQDIESQPHPLVQWDGLLALVTCPLCGLVRQMPAREIRRQLKRPFTGRCLKCRLVGFQRVKRSPPAHSAVDWSRASALKDRAEPHRRRLMVPVLCPFCSEERFLPAKYVAARVRSANFTGRCHHHAKLSGRKDSPKL